MRPSHLMPIVTGAALALVLVGCGSGAPHKGATHIHGIPKEWLAKTSHAWPDSAGFTSSVPVLGDDDCVTYDGLVKIAGDRPEVDEVGYGRLGDTATTSAYRYLCEFLDSDRYAGSFQIVQAPDESEAEQFLDNSMDERDNPVQTNDVTTVTAGGIEIHVLKRWYPTNPQGMYQAIYLDKKRSALAVLEVNSLDKKDFTSYTEKDIAADLVAILGSA